MSPILQLMMAIGIVGSNSLVLGPIASLVAVSFAETSAADVMVASALFGLGTAFGALGIAPKADNFGLAKALRYSLVVLLIGFSLSAAAPVIWVLYLGQAIAGVASGVALPCTYSLAAELAPKGKENETLGRVLLGWTLSMVVGVSIASINADFVHWRGVYVVMVIGALLVLLGLSNLRMNSTQPVNNDISQSPWSALKNPDVISGLTAVALFMAAFYGVYGFLGTHLSTVLQASTVTGGMASLIYGVGFGLISPIDKWMDRYGAISSRAVVFSLLVCTYASIAVASFSVIALLCLCFVWGSVNHLALNLLVAKLTSVDPSRRAAIMGLYSATTYLSMFVGTLIFKDVYEAHGFSTTAFIAAGLITPVALLSLVAIYHRHKKVPIE